ncbi:MAG: glycosyltransferase family 2 protein [Planctomycetota bacterium]
MDDASRPDFGADLSIVVPLYNEQDSVQPLVDAIEAAYIAGGNSDGWELILVDDGSVDETAARACQACESSRLPTRVIRLQRNFGQTAAMQAGIDAATGRLIATMDGDLQNDPRDIARMVDHLDAHDLDLLVGRRANRQDGLLLRKIPSWIANRLIGRVTGVKIRDYGCSLKVYRGSIIRQVRLMGEMHRFIPAWVAGVTSPHRIGEIDVQHHARQFGQSKYGISRTVRVALDLLSVLFFMKFQARPGHFFGTVGIAIGAVAALMLAIVFNAKVMMGQDVGTRPMLLIGSFAALTSIQLIAFGVLAEMISRVASPAEHRVTYIIRTTHKNSASKRQPVATIMMTKEAA